MKVLLINPPVGTNESIYPALPLLQGQLKGNQIDTTIFDLNIEFVKEITNSNYLRKTKNILEKIYQDNDYVNANVNPKYQLNKEQLNELNKKIEKNFIDYKKIIDVYTSSQCCFYENYIKAHKMGKLKNEKIYQKYVKLFHILVSFAFLPFYPDEIYTLHYYSELSFVANNPLYKYSYEDIKDKCSNDKRNIYIDFFEQKISELNLNQYDIIGITIPFEQNTIPALTLGKLLKEKTKAKIVIGGIIPTTTIDSFKKYPEMFGKYFDHILVGDGEKSIVEYVHYIENKIPASEVSGLVYKEEDKIIQNKNTKIKNIEEIYAPNFDNINFDVYRSRNLIPIELSKGCYWHNCVFCYNHLWKKYYIRSVESAANIFENLSTKYGIKNFEILDDAIQVNFAEKFADEIIKRNLNINYIAFFRTEDNLSYELLSKLHKSGLSRIFFGIESGSERILKLMNKGINLDVAERILKDCYEIGIQTDVGLMFGFPTETKEDVLKTIEFYKKNKMYITKANFAIFHLTKSSAMLTEENIKRFQLSNIIQPEEFSEDILFKAPGLPKKELYEMLKENDMQYILHTKWIF